MHYFALPQLLHPFTHVTGGGAVIPRVLLSQVIQVPHRAILQQIRSAHSKMWAHRPEEGKTTRRRSWASGQIVGAHTVNTDHCHDEPLFPASGRWAAAGQTAREQKIKHREHKGIKRHPAEILPLTWRGCRLPAHWPVPPPGGRGSVYRKSQGAQESLGHTGLGCNLSSRFLQLCAPELWSAITTNEIDHFQNFMRWILWPGDLWDENQTQWAAGWFPRQGNDPGPGTQEVFWTR